MVFSVSPCLPGEKASQPRLDPIRQRPEIRHALQFIVRQLDREVMFQPRQQIKRLQTVDAQSFEKIVVGRELLPRDLKMQSRETQDFIERVIDSRSEEHTSELQSLTNLVCRLLLEK